MTGETNLSSTDLARAAFRDVVAPLARPGAPCGLQFNVALKGGSYFVPPSRVTLTREAMESMGRHGEFAELEALWRSSGCEQLLPLLPHLKAIAERIAAEHGSADQTSDAPSNLMYQMY